MKKIMFFTLAFFIVANNLFSKETLMLNAPDGTTAQIVRDNYGVPHIFAKNESALFFAMGFAQAQDRLYQLAIYRLNAMGRLSEYNAITKEDNTSFDIMHRSTFYTKQEVTEMMNNLPADYLNVLVNFSAGINRYIDSMKVNPDKYKYQAFQQLELFGIPVEAWEPLHSAYIMIYFARIFGQFGGNELNNLININSLGKEDFDKFFPINDPDAYTTIEEGVIGAVKKDYEPFNLNVNKNDVDNYYKNKQAIKDMRSKLGIPNKFGSFATLLTSIKTDDGSIMMLGCPQMGTPQQTEMAPVNEVELTCPGLHVGGAAVTGTPSIIIGRTDKFSWTFTSGLTDNTDLFANQSPDTTFKSYTYNNEQKDFEVYYDTILVQKFEGFTLKYDKVPFSFKRSIHGPVSYYDTLSKTAYSEQTSFRKKELGMWSGLYKAHKAADVNEYEQVLKDSPMSFNAFYSDKNTIRYWHTGLYPKRAVNADPRLPVNGDGTQEWQGILEFSELPKDKDPTTGYYINWNNKPAKWWNNGDNIPWTSTNYLGTNILRIKNVVTAKSKMNFNDLENIPKNIKETGTYQQALEFKGDNITDENFLPPGQSQFIDIQGNPSPHTEDQWDLYTNYKFKDWLFGVIDPTGVGDNHISKNETEIFPNPSSSYVTIKYNSMEQSDVKVIISDIFGNIIKSSDETTNLKGQNTLIWNTNDNDSKPVPAGIYIYRIISKNDIISGKINIIR